MKSVIEGKVFYLDRPNIDTDQIIPAQYLDTISFTGLGPYLFENLDLPGFDRGDLRFKEATVLVARDNFGCGSSREHAVWALEDNGFRVVVAPSFARIFRQNMFNRGCLAIELPTVFIDLLFRAQPDNCKVNVKGQVLRFSHGNDKVGGATIKFKLTDFEKKLVLQGGLVDFVAEKY